MGKEYYCIFSDTDDAGGTLACRRVYTDIDTAMADLAELRKTGLCPGAAVLPIEVAGKDNRRPARDSIVIGSRFTPEFMIGNYGTVEIGRQVWTARNVVAPESQPHGVFFNPETAETYFTLDAAEKEADKYPGWHIPTVSEWEDLFAACGGESEAGQVLKATRGWAPGTAGTDRHGFGAIPAGFWCGSFQAAGHDAHFWASGIPGCTRYVKLGTTGSASIYEFAGGSRAAYSLRLVRDRR